MLAQLGGRTVGALQGNTLLTGVSQVHALLLQPTACKINILCGEYACVSTKTRFYCQLKVFAKGNAGINAVFMVFVF